MLNSVDRNFEETEETRETEKFSVEGVARRSWPAGGSKISLSSQLGDSSSENLKESVPLAKSDHGVAR